MFEQFCLSDCGKPSLLCIYMLGTLIVFSQYSIFRLNQWLVYKINIENSILKNINVYVCM